MTLLELQEVLPADTPTILWDRREQANHDDNYLIAATDKNLLGYSHYLNCNVCEVKPIAYHDNTVALYVFIEVDADDQC